MKENFGFRRVAAVSPEVKPADVPGNLAALLSAAGETASAGADVVIFPELAITGYTCADLFFQRPLLDAALDALNVFCTKTGELSPVFILGLPLRVDNLVYNTAAVIHNGSILGIVPKTFLPNTREFYEKRWFASATQSRSESVEINGESVPFGTDLVFTDEHDAGFSIGVEICEDLWSPLPPSTASALNGALIICNPSASDELAGKSEYRRALVAQQSARCLAAYAYAGSGPGESSTDMVFGGHTIIAENGKILAEGRRFEYNTAFLYADVDTEFLMSERHLTQSFARAGEAMPPFRNVLFHTCNVKTKRRKLMRKVDPHPFVPSAVASRNERCAEIFAIQCSGLSTRLRHAGIKSAVVGLSGGLDSTLALLVTAGAFNKLQLPLSGLHAITMPGFGTTKRTFGNSKKLCKALGLELETIDISEACRKHLADIGHDGKTGDVTYENAQARERTQILMDRANMSGGIVIGTGDLSELALGWCTYCGDQMSMYGVNSGVPKTLVRHLIRWFADKHAGDAVATVLEDILATPISPELLPADENGEIAQCTESVVGPYELHDFFLYHFLRSGTSPEKILFLAGEAFGKEFSAKEIRKWMKIFIRRFFAQQFKRSCMPDGPKVGTLNLSPRGDWRMPSDASSAVWTLA